ncbi:MAG TPA: HlyD family efflux transporter periplasmic adaptor subunit [Polyangiaceae bacterium]|jgi:HlyD family secretion protein
MIRNAVAASWAALGAALLLACTRAPPVPPGYQGLVEYDERVVSFEVAGRVGAVDVRRGDLVADAQVLASLDDTMAKLQTDASEEDANAAQADLALLLAGSRKEDIASEADELQAAGSNEALQRTNAERTRALFADGALPKADLDKAEADLKSAVASRQAIEQKLAALRHGARAEEIMRARARVAQAQAQLALQRELLARHVLHALGAGEVVDVAIKAGELAATGTPAVTLADTMHPYVDVFVPQGELEGIHAGAHVDVRVDATTAPFPAQVESVSPDTEFTPKFLFSDRERPHLVVRVRVRVQDPERRLHSGVPAFAQVQR